MSCWGVPRVVPVFKETKRKTTKKIGGLPENPSNGGPHRPIPHTEGFGETRSPAREDPNVCTGVLRNHMSETTSGHRLERISPELMAQKKTKRREHLFLLVCHNGLPQTKSPPKPQTKSPPKTKSSEVALHQHCGPSFKCLELQESELCGVDRSSKCGVSTCNWSGWLWPRGVSRGWAPFVVGWGVNVCGCGGVDPPSWALECLALAIRFSNFRHRFFPFPLLCPA